MKTALKLCTIALALTAGGAAFAHDDAHHPARKAHGEDIGRPGDPAKATRTIAIGMDDNMRFTPSSIQAKRGETIRFVVTNNGKLKHEMVLGSAAELKEHAAQMRKYPEMQHADPNQVSVESGKKGELVWQFTKPGKVDFACLQPGHYEAGMAGKVAVK